jgi:hypothetical protein
MEIKLGPDHPYTLESRSFLALAYQDTGRMAEAIRERSERIGALKRVSLLRHVG